MSSSSSSSSALGFALGQRVEMVARVGPGFPWVFVRAAVVLKITPKQVVFSGLGSNKPDRAWLASGKCVGSPNWAIRPFSAPAAPAAPAVLLGTEEGAIFRASRGAMHGEEIRDFLNPSSLPVAPIAPVAPVAPVAPNLAQLWEDMQRDAVAVYAETQTAIRSGALPPSRAEGSNYSKARKSYLAFWTSPGADAFAWSKARSK